MKHLNITKRLGGAIMSLLLLAMAILIVPAQAGAAQSTTTASVTFTDGSLEMGDITSGSSMNLNFGSHPIPVAAIQYPAENATEHILPVEDSRVSSGNWHVTVAVTAFAGSESSNFEGRIILKDPAVANKNTSAGTAGLSVETEVTVASGAGEVLVMAADDTLPRGVFTATWTDEQVQLSISDAQALNLNPENYAATMTWTLNIGPY